MKGIARETFREIFQNHGVLIPLHVVDSIYLELKNLSELKSEGRVNPAKEFIVAYCDAFKERYGTHPPITGKLAGLAKRIVQDLGSERATNLIRAYLAMNTQFFLIRRHDLVTFEQNLNAVMVTLKTGSTVSQIEARSSENRDANTQAMRSYLESKRKQEPGSDR